MYLVIYIEIRLGNGRKTIYLLFIQINKEISTQMIPTYAIFSNLLLLRYIVFNDFFFFRIITCQVFNLFVYLKLSHSERRAPLCATFSSTQLYQQYPHRLLFISCLINMFISIECKQMAGTLQTSASQISRGCAELVYLTFIDPYLSVDYIVQVKYLQELIYNGQLTHLDNLY